MMAPKIRRKDLDVPENVRDYWKARKEEMVNVLLQSNFDRVTLPHVMVILQRSCLQSMPFSNIIAVRI